MDTEVDLRTVPWYARWVGRNSEDTDAYAIFCHPYGDPFLGGELTRHIVSVTGKDLAEHIVAAHNASHSATHTADAQRVRRP